jgi:hypothetical protein
MQAMINARRFPGTEITSFAFDTTARSPLVFLSASISALTASKTPLITTILESSSNLAYTFFKTASALSSAPI